MYTPEAEEAYRKAEEGKVMLDLENIYKKETVEDVLLHLLLSSIPLASTVCMFGIILMLLLMVSY